jgi:hypothetical protein
MSGVFGPAREFVETVSGRDGVAISEFILVELYLLLRSPAVMTRPLGAAGAADVIAAYRRHPKWMVLGWPSESRPVHAALWKAAAHGSFPRRRIIDLRTSLTLIHQGVTEFATANVRDFKDCGFSRVWNPLA